MAVHMVSHDGTHDLGTFHSDAEAVRAWIADGEPGDRLLETGELMADIAAQLDLPDD